MAETAEQRRQTPASHLLDLDRGRPTPPLMLFPIFWMATMMVKPNDAMFARPTVCCSSRRSSISTT